MPDSAIVYKSRAAYQAMMAHYDQRLAAWPTPYETQFVETRHGRTHVIVCGRADAPPLMIFHGWASNASATYLEYDLVRLGERFRIYLPDTIGQTGRSDAQRPSTEGPAYGEWASDLVNTLNLQTLFLMGISGGGYLALKASAVLGDRVRGVVVLCTAGLAPMRLTSLRFLMGGLPATLWPNEATGLGFVKAMMAPNREILPVHHAMAKDMMFIFKTHRFQGSPKPLSDEELQKITVPTQIVLGDQDVFVNIPKSLTRAQRLMANVTTTVIPDCGHMLTIDHPGLAEERLMMLIGGI